MLTRHALTCTALCLIGCAPSITYVPTNAPPRPMVSRPVETVEVLTTALPERRFREVGMIRVRESEYFALGGLGELVMALRSQAADAGCDAVFIHGPDNEMIHRNRETLEGVAGTCLMYLHEEVHFLAQP